MFVESAPTSPRVPGEAGDAPAPAVSPLVSAAAKYSVPVLSSSAPELEGNWTEVKRRMKEKQAKAEVKIAEVCHYVPCKTLELQMN